jgi:hypothetical protein
MTDLNAPYYQIQAKCKHGCGDHEKGEWRKSKSLRGVTDLGEAEQILAEYMEEFPNSKPYRLVLIRDAYVVEASVTVIWEDPDG